MADYIAGMTDRYAMKEHRRLFAGRRNLTSLAGPVSRARLVRHNTLNPHGFPCIFRSRPKFSQAGTAPAF